MLSYKHDIIKKIKKATLQVRTYITKSLSKRVYKKASLTVEAAFALSIFIFSLVIIMLPFKMLDASRKMLAIAESINKDICMNAYLSNYLDKKDDLNKNEERAAKGRIDIGGISESDGFAAMILPYVIQDVKRLVNDTHITDISTADSQFLVKDDIVTLKISYKYKLPFSVLGLGSISREAVSSRRLWVGREGTSAGDDIEDEDSQTVYIGKTSTRYHLSATCHYLYNNISAVPLSHIKSLRNSRGAKYHACARCGKSAAGTVYILPSGTSYHSRRNCSAMNAYVKTVKKSAVEHMGACSYCGGGH